MIIPATIVKILPDDRLRIEFKPEQSDDALVEIVPRPLDMHPNTHVGSSLKVDYTRENGVERLLYTAAPQARVQGEMVVPRERVDSPKLPHRDGVLALLRNAEPELLTAEGTLGVLWGSQWATGFSLHGMAGFGGLSHVSVERLTVTDPATKRLLDGQWLRVCMFRPENTYVDAWLRPAWLLGRPNSTGAQVKALAEHVLEVLVSERARLAEQRKPVTPSKPDAMRVLDDMEALLTQHRCEYAVFVHELALLLSCEADPDTIIKEVRKHVRSQPAKDVPR